jgi:ribosomal protein L29
MKITDVRALTDAELNEKLFLLKEELFKLRAKKAVGQLEQREKVTLIRKDVARVLLVKRERELGIK